MKPAQAVQAGFSLVEMLVSLVVLALAAVLLTNGIGWVGRSLDLAHQGDARVDSIATAQFLLRQRLAASQPVQDIQAGAGNLDFVGLDNHIDFIAEPEDQAAPDAYQYYRIARDPDGDLTLFSVSTLDPKVDFHNAATVGWTAHPLVKGTAAIEIRYLGRSPFAPRDGLVWQDNWTHRTSMPLLVRVRVSFPEGDIRVWPDLIVHPRAAVQDTCPPEGCPAAKAGTT